MKNQKRDVRKKGKKIDKSKGKLFYALIIVLIIFILVVGFFVLRHSITGDAVIEKVTNVVIGNSIFDDTGGLSGSRDTSVQDVGAQQICGNSITEMGEACDGDDLNGFTCATVAAGFKSGTLRCNADCKQYDVSQCVKGNVINAVSCNQLDVQNAINSASDGDIVAVPAGICRWNTKATINKGIFVRGEGAEKTSIVSNNESVDVLFDVYVINKSFRLSSFKFSGNLSWSFITLGGSFLNLRIDHINFEDMSGAKVRGIALNYFGRRANKGIIGLFDHLNINGSDRGIFLGHYGANNDWNRPDGYGTGDFIFLEDINISGNSGATLDLVDGECGARFVARNNNLINTKISYHDTGSTSGCRSTRLVEIYDNNFSCTIKGYPSCIWSAISFRGGTGVYYNNIIPSYYEDGMGYDTGAATQLWRSYTKGGFPWNTTCDGIFDRICSDFYSHCSGGDKRACGGDWDCVGAGTCNMHQCTTDDDCGANVFCLQKTDGHLDSTGWPCRDQTGRGQDNPINHEQANSPAYWWNNKNINGKLMNVIINNHYIPNFRFILKGRDFYNDSVNYNSLTGMYESIYVDDDGITKEWNYKPYPYPHPLVLIESQIISISTNETCGNGYCNATAGENCSNCTADCGSCVAPPVSERCGNGYCNATAGENCSTCFQDCEICPGSGGGDGGGSGGGGSGSGGGGGNQNQSTNNQTSANQNINNENNNIGALAEAVGGAFSLNDDKIIGTPDEVFDKTRERYIIRYIMLVGICMMILILWAVKLILKHKNEPLVEIAIGDNA